MNRVHTLRTRLTGVYARLRPAVRRTLALQLPDRAAALAYYAFLSVPAVLLLILGVMGLVYDPGGITTLVNRLEGVLPADAVTVLNDVMRGVARGRANGITLILISVPLAVWSASGTMNALMRALNTVHGRTETRGFVRQRVVAALMMAWTLVALALVVGILVLGPVWTARLDDALNAHGVVRWAWWITQWPVVLGGVLLAVTAVLDLGPDLPARRPRRAMLVGGLVGTVAWVLVSTGFSLFVTRFASYDQAWGSLSVVAVTLVWIWLSALALLLGAVVDAQVDNDTGGSG